jgi:Uma2 family endonuclease
MSLPQSQALFTPEEYLALERESDIRHEYLDGLIYAMAGESFEHSTIGSNINAALNYQLRGKPCRSLQPNMKVYSRLPTDTGLKGLFAYPDGLVVCGQPVFHDAHRDVLINPQVIIEVLSKSTEGYDRGEKFARYRQHGSFTDYLLVSQYYPCTEHFTRQPSGEWIYTYETKLEGSVIVASIGCELRLAEVYDRIEFSPSKLPDNPILT